MTNEEKTAAVAKYIIISPDGSITISDQLVKDADANSDVVRYIQEYVVQHLINEAKKWKRENK